VASRATGTQAFLHLFSYPVSLQREHLVKKVLDFYPIRSYLRLGHGYSNDANDTYRGVPHMGYCKRSAPPVLRINQELADVYWFRVKEDNDDGKKN